MVVFVGENGDTDYEGLLGGVHKTIILTGKSGNTPPNQLQANKSHSLEDVAFDGPNIIRTDANFSSNDIKSALNHLGI